MTDKRFNLFDECAASCVHLSPQEKFIPEEIVKCTHKINENGYIAKMRISVETDTVNGI